MKKILILLLLSFTITSCSDDTPTGGIYTHDVTYKVTGYSTDVLITISGQNGITQYTHVDLPFDLYPFKMRSGEFIGFNILDWKNLDSSMVAEIIVDGNVYKSITGTGFLELNGTTP